jgi:L-2,4-diaminobutyrate decarboxylase
MSHSETPRTLSDLYSADTIRSLLSEWQSKLQSHLNSVTTGTSRVLNWETPEAAIRLADSFLDRGRFQRTSDETLKSFSECMDQILSSGQNLHHPRFIGHQVPASIPLAGLLDAIGTMTNQVMAIYEMGPWATAVEFALVGRLCQRIGWDPATSSGLLTSGGSLANLTALLTARNVAFPNSWEQGVPSDAALVVQSDAHYCVARAAGIIGLGTQQVHRVELDEARRMDPKHLDHVLKTLKDQGRRVIAVSACACATPIGAFDPLEDVSAVCRRHNIWLHVDAAHGGASLMSRRHRHLLKGLEQADSVVWDAHKMMYVPALCAAVLYRNRDHRFQTFHQDAPYLFDPSNPGMAEYDSGMRTIECTKRALGFGLWGLWSVFSEELFEQLVDHTFERARQFHEMLEAADDFVTMHVPQCNIVAFRYLPRDMMKESTESQNRFQREIRSRMIRAGRFYIVQTQLKNLAALRVTVMNPLTRREELEELLQEIRRTGEEVRRSQ